jgi:hypothetical protein
MKGEKMKFSELISKWENGWRGKAKDARGEIWEFSGSMRVPKRETNSQPLYVTHVDENWTVVQRPVTFMEAMNSSINDRVNIYPEGEKPSTLAHWTNSFTRITAKDLQKMLNGKWYIEA